MTDAKARLVRMEETGKFVFHGTHLELEEFTPRQAYNYDGVAETPDGEPAVFASGYADYAIFMAIVTAENCPKGYWSSAGTVDGVLKCRVTPETFEQLHESAAGFVYVFDRSDFVTRDGDEVEFVTHRTVKPIEKVRVSYADLPSNIAVTK